MIWISSVLLLFVVGCSGGHKERASMRKHNAQAEYIRRRSGEKVYPEPSLEVVQRESYPWEKRWEDNTGEPAF